MSINKTDFLSKIQEIGTCEDDSTRRTMLTELSDSVSEIFDNVDTLSRANETLTENNESLREANMQLFQRIGAKKDPEDTPPTPPDKPKREYKNLFNDKGELK